MKKTIFALAMIALLWHPITVYADTIYSWKGKDGTLKFSDEPPPEDVTEYQTTVSDVTGGSDQAPGNERRSSYDIMVQKATRESDQLRKERQERAATQAAEKERVAEEKRKARIAAERKRLEQQIEAIKGRAVSPTYPNGMKQAQINALKKEIEKLGDGGGNTGSKKESPDENSDKPDTKY